jgi:hypothetical protein
MTPQEINHAIAEICGWKTLGENLEGDIGETPPENTPHKTTLSPNYCASLDAMHEAESYLPQTKLPQYQARLYHLCARNGNPLALASAPQKAQAFLQTLGKWKPTRKPQTEKPSPQWAISSDNIDYFGHLDSESAALQTGLEIHLDQPFWIAQRTPPTQPESLWHAKAWISHLPQRAKPKSPAELQNWIDWSQNIPPHLIQDLQMLVSSTISLWLSTHNLRPDFTTTKNPQKILPENIVQ